MAMRKEPTMKLTNLIWVLALAGAVAACNSGPPITGERAGINPPPTGGGGGTCDPGGGDGACTTPENEAVYADLTYTDDAGEVFTGADASSAIGSDCIFGTKQSDPLLTGCGNEAGAVIGCFPNCPQGTIDAAADCVAKCTQDATAEASPPGLSDECVACTGETVACGAAFCTDKCVADTNDPKCIACRCDNDCIQDFDSCSGLPSDCECG
jgi:hypothetical protein